LAGFPTLEGKVLLGGAPLDFFDIPAEMTHLTTNLVTINATTSGNAADGSTHNIVVYNPYPPPSLMTPASPTYLADATPLFSWEDNGDQYSLFIASDEDMETIERSYLGLTGSSFELPSGDALPDGAHWWAVRRFVGTDSSSLQADPFKVVIDREAPNVVTPLSPVDDNLVGSLPFTVTVKNNGGTAGVESAPEFNRIELSPVSDFSSDVLVLDSVFGESYTVTDTIDQGRWYWRSSRADLAGNSSAASSVTSFRLDSHKPNVPSILNPAIGDTVQTDGMTLRWSDEAPPPDSAAAAVWYFLQVSSSQFFSNSVYSGTLYVDSLHLPSETFELGTTYYWRVRAIDSAGHSSSYQSPSGQFYYAPYVCADPDGSGTVADPIDLAFLVDYLFSGGAAPVPEVAGSMDCDDTVDPVDLSLLVDYLFAAGDPPCCP